MSENVSWLLELAVKPGQLDGFRELMTEMVESTRGEPGTLVYEWSISDDEGTVHIHERYADSAATLAHMATFGERFAPRFLAAVEPTRWVVYGTPSDEVRQALDGLGAGYMAPFGGFAR
jgi:quinol monooxygenase YgiN